MPLDLVHTLCSTQDLVDVAPQGRAYQSSYSRWSKQIDPMRALQRHGEEFGFHTGLHEKPWWLLDLGAVYRPHYIIIRNRRNLQFAYVARSLEVAVAGDDEVYRTLYVGHADFGCEPQSLPLILWLHGERAVRFVRVSLPDRSCLHLTSVHVLASDALPTHPAPTFVSMRNDGFGERLKGMLNAMTLAEHFGGPFHFTWDALDPLSRENSNFHAIRNMEEIFDPQFVSAYALLRGNGKRLTKIQTIEFDYSRLKPIVDQEMILVHQNAIPKLPNDFRQSIDPQAFARAFWRIRFLPKFERAREAAMAHVFRKPPVAVHVRSGDLVLGTWRFVGRYQEKLIPFFIVVRLLRRLHAEGKEIIVFGQEPLLLRYFADVVPCIPADDLRPGDVGMPEEEALFDVTLMSRCEEIYAGKSGFADLARWIGNRRYIRATEINSGLEPIKSIVAGLDEYVDDPRVSPLHIAAAHWQAYKFGAAILSREQRLVHLDAAVMVDDANPLYLMARASEHYADGTDDLADAALLRAHDVSEGILFGLRSLLCPQWDGYVTGGEYLTVISAAAERGSAVAAACVAVAEQAAGREDKSREAARTAASTARIPFADAISALIAHA